MNILIPTDFSDCANNAIHYALDLASRNNSKVFLLTGYHIPVPAAEMSMNMDSALINDFEREATAQFENLKKDYPDLNKYSCEYRIEVAYAKDAIIKTVDKEEIDLVVMGTHGSKGMIGNFLGSITSSVIQETDCPVLAIPECSKFSKIGKIAFASDFHETDDWSALNPLLDMVRLYEAELLIVNVKHKVSDTGEGEAFEARNLDYFFEGITHSFHTWTSDNVEQGLNDFVEKMGVDMLALMPRKHNIFEMIFKGSITKKLALHTTIPLLAFHS